MQNRDALGADLIKLVDYALFIIDVAMYRSCHIAYSRAGYFIKRSQKQARILTRELPTLNEGIE